MKAAICIDGNVFHGDRHIKLIRAYQKEHGLTDDVIDKMIEAGRIEFGHFGLLNKRFYPDTVRNDVYESIGMIIEIQGED